MLPFLIELFENNTCSNVKLWMRSSPGVRCSTISRRNFIHAGKDVYPDKIRYHWVEYRIERCSERRS